MQAEVEGTQELKDGDTCCEILSSRHNTAFNLKHVADDQGRQKSDIDQGGESPSLTPYGEVLAVDGCWGRELHSSLRAGH